MTVCCSSERPISLLEAVNPTAVYHLVGRLVATPFSCVLFEEDLLELGNCR
jgi:hypothetical protein